ncbi:hypothetical protein D770_08775 [Flammeovirgaceae bacterium 311]|nr:hypothetical protein D770_08775 [Flammeovirgaceae bacterium 311]
MQRLLPIFLTFMALLLAGIPLFAQEAFAPEHRYFQGEVIRKVSVGADGIWVIKGEDSTGLARLDWQGATHDYTATLGLHQPLAGVVGKYKERAFILTKQKQLFAFDKQASIRIAQEQGIDVERVNDLYGSPGYTRIATEKGVFETYDDKKFSQAANTSSREYTTVSANAQHFIDVHPYHVLTSKYSTLQYNFSPITDGETRNYSTFSGSYSTRFYSETTVGMPKNILANEVRRTGSLIDVEILLGTKDGLYVNRKQQWIGNGGIYKEKLYTYLMDTTIYALKNYRDYTFIGSNKGLYYYTSSFRTEYDGKITQVVLDDSYIIYDIAVQETEQIIWLATNKGLLKVANHYKLTRNYQNNSILWAKSLAGKLNKRINSTITDPAGFVYVTGYFSGILEFDGNTMYAQNAKDYFLAKLSATGELVWIRTAANNTTNGSAINEEGHRIGLDSQYNIYTTVHLQNHSPASANYSFGSGGELNNSSTTKTLLLKYSAEGELLQMKELTGFTDFRETQIGVDHQDNFYFSCKLESTNPYNLPAGRAVVKFNPDGQQIWARSFPLALEKFNPGKEGKFYLSGYFKEALTVGTITLQSPVQDNLAIISFDEKGEPLWGNMVRNFSDSYRSRPSPHEWEIQADGGGNTYVGGTTDGAAKFDAYGVNDMNGGGAYYFLAKLDSDGKYLWAQHFGGARSRLAFKDLVVDEQGNAYITGHAKDWLQFGGKKIEAVNDYRIPKIYLAKFDSSGNSQWAQALHDVQFEGTDDHFFSTGKSLALTQNGVLISARIVNDFVLNNILINKQAERGAFYAEISDTYTPTPYNLVKGRSFIDKNGNNIFDEGENALVDQVIKADPGPCYTTTDYSGNYELRLGTGQYTINQLIPRYTDKKIIQSAPEGPHTIVLHEVGTEKSGVDFANTIDTLARQPVHEEVLPPQEPANLIFDFSSSTSRRCFEGTSTVVVYNTGRGDAEDVMVVVEYPEHIIPSSSSPAWLKKEGNILTFKINRLEANSSQYIRIRDYVSCEDESIRGMEQCIKAYLNHTNPTEPDPDWDKSDIELTAACKDNGFVRVNMKNTGAGNMADSAIFNIYLDQAKVHTGKYKLANGESLILNLLANGQPLLFEALLSPHHPLKKSVTINVEGCNTATLPIIAGNMEPNLLPETLRESMQMVCMEIIDSFDPNDKQVVPAGITANHNIMGDEFLEYTIRFQNTGTAAAINIRITDKLDRNLDLSTLKIGAASHPMTWEGETMGSIASITWRFNNINLPDSNANEPASHGFVKFRIRPKQSLEKGTIIKNKADIYFDFNSPVTTNEVFNTIGLPELVPGRRVVIQPCDARVNLAEEQNTEVLVCGDDQYQLSRLLPPAGSGQWKVTRGTAIVEDPFSHQTLASNLSLGENEFSWEVTYCDQVVSSKVTVIREQPLEQPQATHPAYICQGEPYPAITATGEGVEWYRDEALTQLVLRGNTYQPLGQQSEMLYVIQRNKHCSSAPTVVPVVVHQQPLPPVATPVETCVDLVPPVLTAQGSNLRWYADAGKQQLLAEGENFSPADMGSRSYWVTQSSEYCESTPAEVQFTAKLYDPAKAKIANVVTPNGDDKNQLYYVKDFEGKECMGEFISIKIYNRWGRQVYESKAADFKWDASQLPTGVYYYRMDYQLNKFQGSIQVLR